MTRKKWILVLAPLGIAVFVFIGGQIVLLLWNWLVPTLFKGPLVTFWQAVGLLALCRILFGGSVMGRAGSNSRRRMAERWEKMTPEERETFRQGLNVARDGSAAPAP